MNVAPEARKTICIDFDGTLYPWGPIDDRPAPLPGAVEVVRKLRERGFRIVVLTSRLSWEWVERKAAELGVDALEFMADQRHHIWTMLEADGIPADRITGSKVPALYYIDDRALPFDGDWGAVSDRLAEEGAYRS